MKLGTIIDAGSGFCSENVLALTPISFIQVKTKAVLDTTGAKLEHSLQKSFRHLAEERDCKFQVYRFLKSPKFMSPWILSNSRQSWHSLVLARNETLSMQ